MSLRDANVRETPGCFRVVREIRGLSFSVALCLRGYRMTFTASEISTEFRFGVQPSGCADFEQAKA